MTSLSKKYTATILLGTLVSFTTLGQTNVSGGIYTNTIWTTINSPYIVVDTIVVFPGVTLTIQPGVVVKFDNNKRLEIRQAKLIAWGTSTDSIIFTSNSATPTYGIWSEIFLNGGTDTLLFNYCGFNYANTALNDPNSYNCLVIKNSTFRYNNIGLLGNFCSSVEIDTCTFDNNATCGIGELTNFNVDFCEFTNNGVGLRKDVFSSAWANITNCHFYFNQVGLGSLGLCQVENCTVKYNQHGICDGPFGGSLTTIRSCVIDSNYVDGLAINSGDTVINNTIRYNPVGLTDSMNAQADINLITQNTIENNGIGIKFLHSTHQLYCNKICNSASYDLYYSVAFGSNLNAPNNYWCTPDSASTTGRIYDGYDNISLGLVNFMPLDTQQCYLQAGIETKMISGLGLRIYPNPATTELKVQSAEGKIKEIEIYSVLYEKLISQQQATIDVSHLNPGIYFVKVLTDKGIVATRFVKQ